MSFGDSFFFFSPVKSIKVLAVRKIAKWFWVGAKPSFAFMHFQSQPLNLSHKLLFALSACVSLLCLLYFPFYISLLPYKSLIQPSTRENVSARKKHEGSVETLRAYSYIYNDRRFAKVRCLIPSIYADHE